MNTCRELNTSKLYLISAIKQIWCGGAAGAGGCCTVVLLCVEGTRGALLTLNLVVPGKELLSLWRPGSQEEVGGWAALG